MPDVCVSVVTDTPLDKMLAACLMLPAAATLAPPWPGDGPAPKCGPKASRPITQTKTAAYEAALEKGAALPSVVMCRPYDGERQNA